MSLFVKAELDSKIYRVKRRLDVTVPRLYATLRKSVLYYAEPKRIRPFGSKNVVILQLVRTANA